MTNESKKSNFAAAVYNSGTGDRMALLKFVEKLKKQNVRIGGVLQEAILGSDGEITACIATSATNVTKALANLSV